MRTSNLNTDLKERLVFSSLELEIEILGGIKLSNFSQLRATLKIYPAQEEVVIPIRYTIDLYNSDQVEKLSRKTAEQFQLQISETRIILLELIEALESYRVEVLQKAESLHQQVKILTEEEKKEAAEYLLSKDLMGRMTSDMGKSGIVGEEVNSMLMFLAFTSRKLEHPLSVLTLGQSGTGKTYLQEKVSALIPEEDKIEITSFTKNALYYFREEELNRKVLLIEDMEGASSTEVMYSIRELSSKHQLTKMVPERDQFGNTKTKTVILKARVAISATSTRDIIYEDNSNRSLLLFPDTSKKMDEEIMNYQLAKQAGLIDKEEEKRIQVLFQNAQRMLEPVNIINPYAPLLKLPATIYTPRRAMNLYLGLIEAITFLHQFQRKKNKAGFLETTTEDIKWANKLIAEVFIRKSDELSCAGRNALERVKSHLKTKKKDEFQTAEIVKELRINRSSLKRYLKEWRNNQFVQVSKGGNRYTGLNYKIVSPNEYEVLKESIADTLNKQLVSISKKSSSGPVVHSGPK